MQLHYKIIKVINKETAVLAVVSTKHTANF